MNSHNRSSRFILALLSAPAIAMAENNLDIGVVLDGQYKSHESGLSNVSQGFSLGHSELTLSAPVDDRFFGRMSAVLEDHEGATEVELEEAFLQTTDMPANLTLTAGRFLSQAGYLNSRHMHEDSFSERPAVYQALLGGHYFDDGARLNVLLPTPFYWRIGVEAFDGARLLGESHEEDIGVLTLNSKIGGDIGTDNSWQAGLSYLKNRLTDIDSHEEDAHDEEEHEESDHEGEHAEHSHRALYTAENVYIADAVWKWAPGGNAKERQWVVSAEYLRGEDINAHATDEVHEGWYVSAVHRFAPQWSIGARYGEVDLQDVHDDHFHRQTLEESQGSLTWSNSHFSNVRLSYSHQTADGVEAAHDAVTLQYTMIMGAHAAHEF